MIHFHGFKMGSKLEKLGCQRTSSHMDIKVMHFCFSFKNPQEKRSQEHEVSLVECTSTGLMNAEKESPKGHQKLTLNFLRDSVWAYECKFNEIEGAKKVTIGFIVFLMQFSWQWR